MYTALMPTFVRGVSHVTSDIPSSNIKLMTAEGVREYRKKVKLLGIATKNGNKEVYLDYVKNELNQFERELSNFLNDPEMTKQYKMDEDDQYGWNIYYELMDKITVCKYICKDKHRGT